jgi:restriction endonuclease
MDTKWESFEKLVQAIRMIEQRGAKVSWGQAINGVPFDATVLRSYGDFDILIVIECVSSSAYISKAQMDHFVGKSQQANAHIAIFVSQTEFSEESLNIADEHSIWLLSAKTLEESSLDVLARIFQVVINIYQFKFRVEAGNFEVQLPEESGLLKLGMQETRFEGPGIDTTPEKLVEGARTQVSRLATGKPQIFRIPFPKGTVAVHPNVRTSRLPVTEFSFTYRLIPVCGWGKTEFENGPYLSDPTLREELAKRSPSSDPSKIEVGFDTKLRAGKFYYNPKLHFSYYCERIKNGKATMALIESRQNGMLVQARWNILTEDSRRYVEITEQERSFANLNQFIRAFFQILKRFSNII